MPGRETRCSIELAEKIAEHVRLGSYWEPACVAAGVPYSTMRRWMQLAAEAESNGDEHTIYSRFRRVLEKATAEAETTLVKMVAATPDDWRAQAFVLERRHRDRWGKQETTVNQVNVVVSDQLVAQLADALAVARANPAIELDSKSIQHFPLLSSSTEETESTLSRAARIPDLVPTKE